MSDLHHLEGEFHFKGWPRAIESRKKIKLPSPEIVSQCREMGRGEELGNLWGKRGKPDHEMRNNTEGSG